MTYQIGEHVQDKGIYMGQAAVFKHFGLAQSFNVFAAPGDMFQEGQKRLQCDFNFAVDFIGLLEEINAHNGAVYSSEEQLTQAIKDGKYSGEWVLPNFTTMHHIISKNKESGDFKDSYAKAGFNAMGGEAFYWVMRSDDTLIEATDMYCIDTGRFLTKTLSDDAEASIRPVRFEPV